MVTVDLENSGIHGGDITSLHERVCKIHERIHRVDGTIENAWVELPYSIDTLLPEIIAQAKIVRETCDVMFVVGIGGSYLGAFAGLNMLKQFTDFPIKFLGTSFDPMVINHAVKKYASKRICVNVISKSGTTMEIMETIKFLDQTIKPTKIYYTTDEHNGHLRELANLHGTPTFPLPKGVGGRFSVLSAVGLFPFAVAGIDVAALVNGAKVAYKDCKSVDCGAYKYAAARFINYTKANKSVEILASFYECLGGLGGWWQQLFGESEGKEHKGLFPASLIFSRDLHSMGQFIQQGTPLLFETFLNVKTPPVNIPAYNKYNNAAILGTTTAHAGAGVGVITLTIDAINAENLGYLFYFFEIACAMSAYLIDVNPFDQPGVEAYKNEMRKYL